MLDAHEDGAALRDQAVLVRAAHHSDILEIELTARKIPYVKFGGLRFTDTAHVKDFIATARILVNPADDLAWFRLLRLHEGIGPVHARRVLAALALDGGDPDTGPRPTATGLRQPRRHRPGPSGLWPPPSACSPTRPGRRPDRPRRSWHCWIR